MATNVVLNGVTYSVPAYLDTGWAQGTGNLSQYLVAIASGTLQQTGGAFTLMADVNFGSGFGLISKYYKSESANIASAGVMRLANTDLIEWRNGTNTGNDVLSVNGSDVLQYNGATILTGSGGGYVSSITGTSHQVIASASTGAITLSLPQSIDTTSSPKFASVVFPDSTTDTITLIAPSSVTTYTFTLPPNSGTSGYLLKTDGSGGTSWVQSNVGAGTSGQNAVYNGTNSITSGATMSMNNTKITSLANGSSAQDAAAFGQIPVANSTTSASSTTYAAGTSIATATLTTTGKSVMLVATGSISTPTTAGNVAANLTMQILQDGTAFGGGTQTFSYYNASGGSAPHFAIPFSLSALVTPSAASHTWTLEYTLTGTGMTGSPTATDFSLTAFEVH